MANGQCINSNASIPSTSTTASNTTIASGDSNNNNANDDHDAAMSSPTGDVTTDKKKKLSPAVAMAEASLLSQKAALKEATNFESLIMLQREELLL